MKPLPGIDISGTNDRLGGTDDRSGGTDDRFLSSVRRRTFLGRGIGGLGLLGLNALLDPRLFAADSSHGVINPLHHPAKAKRIIFLYQAGGPSHLETFDFKPKLREMHGKTMPESLTKGQQIAQLQGRPLVCFGPQHEFRKFGKSGQEMCELFPHIGSVSDHICIWWIPSLIAMGCRIGARMTMAAGVSSRDPIIRNKIFTNIRKIFLSLDISRIKFVLASGIFQEAISQAGR